MAEINELFEKQFPDILRRALRSASAAQDIGLNHVTERRIGLLAAEYLEARRDFIANYAHDEMGEEGHPEDYFHNTAERLAEQLSEEIVHIASSRDTNQIIPGDFVVALISICPAPPIC